MIKNFTFIIIIFLSSFAHSQSINGNLTFNSYPSPYVSDWETNPAALGGLTVFNNSSSAIEVRLRAIVTKQGRGEVFRSLTNPIPLTGAPVQVIDNTRLISFEDASYTDADYRNSVQQTGRLLEGEYTVCINIENLTGAILASNICADFTILYPSAPQLISPEDNANLDPMVSYPTFQWVPVIVPSAYEIKYTLRIVEVMMSQTPLQAISANYPVYENNQISGSTFTYPLDAPELEAGKTYAWQIQALDQFGFPPTQNDGKSEIFTFVKGSGSGTGNLTVIFPANNDTIPWDYFPVIFRFDPYSDSYYRCSVMFELFENGSSLYTRDRTGSNEIRWPFGPERSQEEALGGLNITQEESQHLAINKRLDDSPTPPMFVHGREYNWTADIEIRSRARTEISGRLNSSFNVGMGKPILRQPANNDTISPGEINLLFTTSSAPRKIAPPYPILQSGRGRTPATFFNGGINERWILEISRDSFLTSGTNLADETLGSGIDLNAAIDNPSSIISQLYKDVNVPYTANDTGWYYWRVKWLSDPSNISSNAYRVSDIYRFYVGTRDTSTRAGDTTEVPTPGSCIADCEAPLILASERVPVTTASVGSRLTIGLFTLNVTEINWSGQTANGRGTINVPFLKAPIKVSFSNIRVNAANKIYEGTVKAEYDNESVIPSSLLSAGGLLTGLTDTELQNLNSFVSQTSRLVSAFTSTTPIGMPIGLDQVIEGRRYTIAIVGLDFTPERAELNAMVALDFPELHGWLGLGAKEICFHPNGLGGLGKGMLYLPIDKDYLWSDDLTIRLKGTRFSSDYTTVVDSGTFVRWDCNGFVNLTISGEVIFGTNLLVEDLTDGGIGTDQIKAEFRTTIRKHNNWISSLTFNKPFQIKGIEGFGFHIQEAWLDFSDRDNPATFNFPRNYNFRPTEFGDTTGAGDYQLLWKGFYLKRAAFKLPGEFRNNDSPTQRVSFAVNDMLIDRTGFSASVRAENVLRAGNLDGWSFSIDTIYFDMTQTSFSQAGFNGQIGTSFTDSTLIYRSVLSMDTSRNFSYNFIVQPRSRINANIWQATLELEPTTNIRVTIDSSGFFARAELNGRLSINANLPAIGQTNFTAMRFQGLAFQTKSPYIVCPDSCVRFGTASPQKFIALEQYDYSPEYPIPPDGGQAGGFPISIQNIGITTRTGSDGSPLAGIVFTMSLNLTGESNTFSAATTLAILGRLNLSGSGGRQYWEFNSVDLDSVNVSGSVGVVSLEGGLRFYNQDVTYGNGIKGFIRATFRPTIAAQVTAQFGSKSGFRYWFVDAQVVFNPGITVFSGLDVYGFGGGAWYKMTRTSPLPNAQSLTTADTSGRGRPGLTLSGVTFVPDNNSNFGFQATLIFGNTGGGQTYNADVTFGAEFNVSGGISQMYLNGNVYFITEINDRRDVPIKGSANISYDFSRNIFSGIFTVNANVYEVLTGNGTVNIYASPETWYIHIGTPTQPINLNIASLATFQAYFMVGMQLPPPAPVPENVMSIIGTSMTFPSRDETATRNGNGFAFGARFSFSTGRLAFGPFYARFGMGLGFDMAFKEYPGLTCEGLPPGTPIGIDGWYATGQLYAYIQGDIGIYVDIWFTSGEFKIIEVGAAAAMQGGLPNPSWLKGACGGYYSILGGLVKGNCRFEFSIGQECRIPTESPLADIKILADLDPPNGATNVDPYINPLAVFNAEVEKTFDIEQVRNDGTKVNRRFRFIIEKFELKKGSQIISCQRQVANDKLSSVIIPNDMLLGNTSYNVTIRIRGEEYNFLTGTWAVARKVDGSAITAELSHNFSTGNVPDYIPANQVAYSYPFHTQRFFLIDECNLGFVILKQGRPDLFSISEPGYSISYQIKFIPIEGGQPITTEASYNNSAKSINFQIPSSLQTSTTYAAQLIKKRTKIVTPGQQLQGYLGPTISLNYNEKLKNIVRLDTTEVFAGVRVRQNRIDGRLASSPDEKLYYVFFFRTSQFRNLQTKVNGMANLSTDRVSQIALFLLTEELKPTFSTSEKFDVFDVNGYSYRIALTNYKVQPLVRVLDGLDNNWYNSFAYPIIYEYYNTLKNFVTWRLRDPLPAGIPPVNTIEITNPSDPLLESEYLPQSQSPSSQFALLFTSFGFGNISGFGGGGVPMPTYTGPQVKLNMRTATWVWVDYQLLKQRTANYIRLVGHPNTSEFYTEPLRSQMLRFLGSTWRPLFRGTYKAGFYYYPIHCIDPDQFYLPTHYKNYSY
ncbi:hypothetical protein [Ignavibacterium sp.]|uniref:hypothetical protein n=1 Tax=Ignavibacterium sp. TaxID=2651167 RepID=UPI00220BC2EB|nr:hypothetical protein [Ignavibacterium sp.]BDQ02020.1 MAG: hypothetical protein KatS3mg037_0595 [Ignavibacterium sp.]